MFKIKNIKKKFCFVIGLFGLVIPLITHLSLWTFGFMAGSGFAGWMLLPDEKEDNNK